MADPPNPPSITTGEFELPPSAAEAVQNNKEVSWSATPQEIDQATIEKIKKKITYEITASLSVKVVLTETFTKFKVIDPKLLYTSPMDSSIIIRTADDFGKIKDADFPTLFPAEIKNGKTWLSLFLVSEIPIAKLKRSSFGFYEYASKKIWIQESSSFASSNIKSIGFFIRKD